MDSQTSKEDRYKIIKRPRMKYTPQQVERLEQIFQENQYPDSILTEDLAMDLGVSTDRISIWFQNRRSKFKRQRLPDHLQWMRKQVYQSDQGFHSPQLPAFSPSCHVLSPLEPQFSRRGSPVDAASPKTPQACIQNKQRQVESLPVISSPMIMWNGYNCYIQKPNTEPVLQKNHHNTQGLQHGIMKENCFNRSQKTGFPDQHMTNSAPLAQQDRFLEENQISDSAHPHNSTISARTPMWYHQRIPFHPIIGANLNWNQPMTHVPARSLHMTLPVQTATEYQPSPNTRVPKHLSNHNPRSLSATSFSSNPDSENCEKTTPCFNLQVKSPNRNFNETSSTLLPFQNPQLVQKQPASTTVEHKDWELEDQLLQQKAIECLEQWC